MHKKIVMSFVANRELKELLETWAKADERSVSATLRRILAAEAQRRQQQTTSNFTPDTDIVATTRDLPPSTRQGAVQRKTQ